MPRRKTRSCSTYSPDFQPATSLRQQGKRQFFTFDDFVDELGAPRMVITIGRSADSDIQILDDLTVSNKHAELWRERDGTMRLMTAQRCKNGIFVNSRGLTEPTLLVVGMRIRMGNTILFAGNDEGSTPIEGHTIDDCIRHGKEIYGSCNTAAQYLDRSPSHIRDRSLPTPLREQRRIAKKQSSRKRQAKRTSRPRS